MSEPVQTQERKQRGVRQKYSDSLIDETIRVWQPRSDKPISRDDAIVILDRMIGVFRPLVINEARKRREKEEPSKRRKDTER